MRPPPPPPPPPSLKIAVLDSSNFNHYKHICKSYSHTICLYVVRTCGSGDEHENGCAYDVKVLGHCPAVACRVWTRIYCEKHGVSSARLLRGRKTYEPCQPIDTTGPTPHLTRDTAESCPVHASAMCSFLRVGIMKTTAHY